ncbi:MAG: class I SAM-dependent methyltransferase, partial [Saprospiraceae bacterium]|nr:class I SAM-dependent methyltransferase [Saprospiraceae bacterium]
IVHFENKHRHPWELARYKIIKEHVHQLINGLPNIRPCILDIGCGDAYLVHQLSKDFPQADFIGVDINFTDDLLTKIRSNISTNNLQIFQSLEDIKLPDATINSILLLDVIEHIEDEIGFLKSLEGYAYISEKAPLLITVPAYQGLFAFHDVILEHYRRYTNNTLRSRLRTAGYTTSYERYFFFILIFPRIIQLILEKIKKPIINRASDLANWKGGKALTIIIETILWMDYQIGGLFKILGLKLPGLSNLVICHRSA